MPATPDRITMSRGLALLFGAGATLVTITLLLPHRDGEAQAGLLIPAGLAYVVVVLLLMAPHRWSPTALAILLAFGSALVALCVHFGGPAGGVYAFMEVWVALYAAAFFNLRVILAELAWAAATYALVLATGDDVRPPAAHWLMAVGTSAVAAALIFTLTRELRSRAVDLASVSTLANEIGSATEVNRAGIAGRICEGVLRSTGAGAVTLLAEQGDAEGLQVAGTVGDAALAAPFERPEGLAARDRAARSGQPAHVASGAGVVGLIAPVRREQRVVGLLLVAWERPRRRVPPRMAQTLALFAAEAGVALQRIDHQARDRERRALALNDEIVQGLVVAKYALRGGRPEVGEQAVDETLGRARALVERQLEDLHGAGAPEPGSLRVGRPGQADGDH